MKKILCVIRTSTVGQDTESQHNDMLGFLTSKGLKYSEDEIEWIEVAGASARSVNQEYLDMLESIKATILSNETIKAVAFWHLNRLGRWEKYIVDMKDWFINNHIQVYVKTPNLTLLKEDGSLDNGANIAWGVFASMVSYDTMEMMEKMQRGKENLKAKGKWVGTKLHYGFTVNSDKDVVVDYDAMNNVVMIYEEYSTGKYSTAKLATELKNRGYSFSERHIYLILTNEMYKQFVGEELWNKCEKVRKGNTIGIRTKESKYTHLALKVLKCSCGSNYMGENFHYACYKKKHKSRFPDHVCNNSPTIKCEVVDTILWDMASTIHQGYLLKVDTENITELTNKRNVLIQKINKDNVDLGKCNVKLENAKNLYMEAEISKADYDKRKNIINADASRLTEEIEKMHYEVKQIDESIENLQNPNMEAQVALMSSVGDITKQDEMREIIMKHIKYATLSYTQHNGRKCVLITVIDRYDNKREFIYDYNKTKRDSDLFNKLYMIRKDGEVVKYSYSKKKITDILHNSLLGFGEQIKDTNAIFKYLYSMDYMKYEKILEIYKIDKTITEDDLQRLEKYKNEDGSIRPTKLLKMMMGIQGLSLE